ncbi:hypothetical protein CK203_084250 [Vitis vinifera]|uniref:DUF659 domain-containing protein n=1 Tax=Vitis vinifera TaxID=29760 RepID=A0A438BMI8_VITVI|nr:hypothetical protein CK203_084250 [Vitis vinifera]
MNMGSEYVNEDLFGLEDEDIGEEINSRTNVTNISSGGSNRGGSGGRTFSSKKPRQKGPMDHFFTPNAEMVVQNQRSGKMNQTTINDAYKKEARERACTLITRWMYEAAIPFNAVTYPSFQPMIEAIGQYGVGMKGPTFHEGTMFMQSIDASSMIKTGEKMFELLDKWVEQVGEENVIQVITDNHSSYVMAGRLLELKRPHLYWTPCAAHCLDLMLEDIGKLPNIKRTLERAISLNGYIYNRSGLLNMMRRFTGQRELLRPAKTRFATVSGPLVRVLRLVDGEKKAPMGYIYEAMNRAKDAIVRSFNGNEEKYKEIFNIIDKRWEIQLHRPLHAAGYFLNPEFFYDKPEIEHDADIMSDLYKCILRLTRDPAKQEKVVAKVSLFTNAQGLFGNELAVRTRKTRAPGDFVFDDDNLTWGDVARAVGAEEARFDTRARARASSSIIPPTRGIASSSRTLPSYSLIDEDEDGDMVDSADEEDGEGYKCGDGNDDDDDFVDLEEE